MVFNERGVFVKKIGFSLLMMLFLALTVQGALAVPGDILFTDDAGGSVNALWTGLQDGQAISYVTSTPSPYSGNASGKWGNQATNRGSYTGVNMSGFTSGNRTIEFQFYDGGGYTTNGQAIVFNIDNSSAGYTGSNGALQFCAMCGNIDSGSWTLYTESSGYTAYSTRTTGSWIPVRMVIDNDHGIWYVSVNGAGNVTRNFIAGTNLQYLKLSHVSTGSGGYWAYDELKVCEGNYCGTPAVANTLTVSVSNNVTGTSIGSLTFSNVTGSLTFNYFNITSTGFCVTYTGNGTGTNCTTSGSGANTFFNVTTSSSITGTQSVSASTYQALLNVSVYRLFLNTSISGFNVTNNKAFNTTTGESVLLRANNGSNNVQVAVAGNYTLNYTFTAQSLTTTNVNATGIYDNQFTIGANYQGLGISTFTIQTINQTLTLNNITNTTVGSVVLQLLQGYDYYFQITGDTHATQNITLPANSSTNTYNFSVYLTNTINMTFYDEITESIINETVTLQVISDSFAQNYTINSTQTSGFNVSLLSPNQYTLRYSAPSYTQRDYYINLTNGTYNNIDLYLLDTTTANDVIATVETTGSIRVEGAIIKLLRYYVTCNCFKIVQMSTTSGEGQSLFWVQPLQGYYKWSVDYQGSNKFLSATSQQIVSDTVFFSISLQDDFYQSFAALTGMTNILTYNTTSGVMEYSYSDPSGLTTQGCLNVRYVNGTNWDERESCVSGSSGSVILILNNNTQYRYNAYIDTSTIYTQRVVLSGWTDQLSNFNFGLNGVFLSTSVLIGLSVIFSFSAIAVVITNGLGLILIYWLGFTTFQTGFIITFSAMAIGMGVFLLRK